MINYAHRGASEYAPENTLSSFYLGLLQGANGIETDVQKTKDGVLVLFHDDTLDRVSNKQGKLCDYTWNELKNIEIYGNCTTGFYDRIVTLREFLERFSQYDINFAIELKGADVEEESRSPGCGTAGEKRHSKPEPLPHQDHPLRRRSAEGRGFRGEAADI